MQINILVVLAIVIILFIILIYFIKRSETFPKVLQISFRYFIYILCILAQQVELTDGKTKKQFVVNTIKTIITKIFYSLHLPVRSIDDFIEIYFENGLIENIVQKVYDDNKENINNVEQMLRREIMRGQEDLYKSIIHSISKYDK